jgi:hypothetical protein
MAQELFDYGRMFWRNDTDRHYVVYAYGAWQSYRNTWFEGDPTFTCGGPDSPPTPVRGFGKLWCTDSTVRNAIGNATTGEWPETNTIQEFQGGWMMRTEGGDVFAFFLSGSWRQS